MKKIPSPVAVGTDMEVFLFDNDKSRVVPCVGLLPGTKDKPFQFSDLPNGYWVQEDNVMVEFNVPAATSYNAFAKSLKVIKNRVMQEFEKLYPEKYSLYVSKHSHVFSDRELDSKQAQTIGCDPDFDAYEGGKIRTNPPSPGLRRSCGGHIHIGGDFKCPDFVSALFMELFMVLRCNVRPYPTDPRLEWYGQPGIYRPKPYGIEYRTPSNAWFTRGHAQTVGEGALRCAKYLTENSAITIQGAFRKVPWLKLKTYMLMDNDSREASELYDEILTAARNAGIPV